MTPLLEVPSEYVPLDSPETVAETARHRGLTEEETRRLLKQDHVKARHYFNELYHVQVTAYGPGCLHINIRCLDGGTFKDWKDFQQIKNEVAGPEREAVELYPAESRKVDEANKWHLWVQPEGHRIDVGWERPL